MTDRERLIELIKKAKKNTKGASCDLEREMLFADCLLENGVIVPPCKVGDTVYMVSGSMNMMFEMKIKSCIFDTDNVAFDERAIGKTVFLTPEEAEKHLLKGVTSNE